MIVCFHLTLNFVSLSRALPRNNIIFNWTINRNVDEGERFEILVQGFRRKTTQHMLWNIETIALFMLSSIYLSLVPSYMTTCIYEIKRYEMKSSYCVYRYYHFCCFD